MYLMNSISDAKKECLRIQEVQVIQLQKTLLSHQEQSMPIKYLLKDCTSRNYVAHWLIGVLQPKSRALSGQCRHVAVLLQISSMGPDIVPTLNIK